MDYIGGYLKQNENGWELIARFRKDYNGSYVFSETQKQLDIALSEIERSLTDENGEIKIHGAKEAGEVQHVFQIITTSEKIEEILEEL